MKHVISYSNKECHVTQCDSDGKFAQTEPLYAGIPAHEEIGEEGRNGMSALMTLAAANVDILRTFMESLPDNDRALLGKILDKREIYNKRMGRQVNFNIWLNNHNRMNFEGSEKAIPQD